VSDLSSKSDRGTKVTREKPCVRCGAQVFYASANRCVACTNERMNARTKEFQALKEENARLLKELSLIRGSHDAGGA
jgi:ribosomal protein L37E